MSDVESNNIIGAHVRVLAGFGEGQTAKVESMLPNGNVNLVLDSGDPLGDGFVRGNYGRDNVEVIDADTNGDGTLNVEDMLPPRGTVVLNPQSGSPYLVDARAGDTLLVYRLVIVDGEDIRFVDATSPGSLSVEEVASMPWMNPQPSGASLVAMVMEMAERRRRVADDYESQWRTAESEFESFKANATYVAHAYAERAGLCGQFDEAMVEIGLEPRSRDWEVQFTVTFTGSVLVNARTEEDAHDLAMSEGGVEGWQGMDSWIQNRITSSYQDCIEVE